ncbi:hypothetical protein BACCIP111895_04892 [Neobacillus rhizosphaerae]|uniref:Uncharacterized protein n=1 Tax=Neobacillus rhizosphaerae TaxID=2880965 RepID=A0ABM9EZM5_9BACI|nr:hypothetical protein [Neobacillus rhizosphaerae]CAH2717667.1 hypothetical protein BACCIP111895_04892 [Neobacillus rhizosphaerae]
MNAKTLLEWERKLDAKNQTIKGFWDYFKKWRTEDKYEYLDTFKGKLYEEFIGVEENSIQVRYPFSRIEASVFFNVNIYYFDKEIGTYCMEFDLDGEVLDDYLDFVSIPLENKMLEIRYNISTVRKALKEGIEMKAISNITGIDEASIEIIKKKYCYANGVLMLKI